MRLRFLALPLFALWGSVACSSGGDDSGSSSSEFAARYCALFKPCCAKAGMPTTQDLCHLMFGAAVAKDQAAAEECIAQYEAWAQEADWCETFGSKPRPASCVKAYPEDPSKPSGSKKPGESCSVSSDCAASSKGEVDCYHDFDANSDYCRVRVLAPVGAACTGTKLGNVTVFEGQSQSGATEVSVCDADAGAYCDDGTCAARVAVGGACGGYASCAGTDTYCAGTCKTKVPAGSSCSDSSDACQDDAYCPFPEDVCKARLADGAACSSNEECLSSYCDGACKAHPGFGGLALGMFCA